jgi:dipeptidyl aminopeptidase/acylaminoacyl peptidase
MTWNLQRNAMVTCAFLALLTQGAACLGASGQSSEPLTVESALRAHSFGDFSPLSFSPDGEWLAYVVRDNARIPEKREDETEDEHYARTGVDVRNVATDVWISNTRTGETRNVTDRIGSNWEPNWSPDGRHLAFLSDRDGSGQATLWIWEMENGSLTKVSSLGARPAYLCPGMAWTRDSQHIVLTVVPEGFTADLYAKKVSSSETDGKTEPSGSATVYRSGSSRDSSSQFNLDGHYLHDLALVDIRNGNYRILVGGRRIEWFSVSPDGSRVAFTQPKRIHPPGRVRREYDLSSLDLATMREDRVVANTVVGDVFGWSPDGSLICYGVLGPGEEGYQVFVVPADGSGPPRRLASLPEAPGPYAMPLWDATGRNAYLVIDGSFWKLDVVANSAKELARIPGRRIVRRIAREDGQFWMTEDGKSTVVLAHDDEAKQDGFYKIDLETGQSTKLLERQQCYSCNYRGSRFGLRNLAASNGLIAYIAQDASHPPELWVADSSFAHTRQLTDLNPAFDSVQFGQGRLIDWMSEDGRRLKGALLLPSNYREGTKYPMLVYVYPRAFSDSFDEFGFSEFPGPFNMQLFATRGYVVLLPDVAKEKGNGMQSLSKSVLPGVNAVIQMGIADPDRVGVMGFSAGGYAALALAVQTNRFKAALAAGGFTDWKELVGVMWKDGVGYHLDDVESEMGGNPWQFPLRYLQNSPLSYLDRVETPLLVIHGEADSVIASWFSDQVFVGLRELGKEVEYVKYGAEGHSPRDWSYPNQVDVCNRMLAWFRRYLKASTQ